MVPWAAMGDPPEEFTWIDAPGGSVTASTVDFDTWMELMAEFVYDHGTPFDFLDPNGEPDGAAERNGRAEPDLMQCDANGNRIPEATEFAVLAAICNNTSHPLHNTVHEAFKANAVQCQIDLGSVADTLCPAVRFVMAAYGTLGDGDYQRYTYQGADYGYAFIGSWGAHANVVFALWAYLSPWQEGAPDSAKYQRLVSLLSACEGDTDSDAVPNINEFYGQGQDRMSYVAAAIDPLVCVSASDPYHVCEGPPPDHRWGVDYFYNPTNRNVYHLTISVPWPMLEHYAENYAIHGVPVPGHLTTIRSEAENQWLQGHVVSIAGATCFMGATDKDTEGVWKWIENDVQFWQGGANGYRVGGRYANWNTAEPNNSQEEDYGEILTTGKWNDDCRNGATSRRGIVEFTNGGAGYPDTYPANGLPDWWEPYIGQRVFPLLPTPVGLWEFDNPANLNHATYGSDLERVGTDAAVPGVSGADGATKIGVGSYYQATPGLAANEGSPTVAHWTLVFDFKVPEVPGLSYAFFQTDATNTSDAECWVDAASGAIGVDDTGYSTTTIAPNTWYRLVIVADLGSSYRYYLDGLLIGAAPDRSRIEPWSRFGIIPAGGWGGYPDKLLFFADNDGGDNEITVSLVALYGTKLTGEQIAALSQAGGPLTFGAEGEGEGEENPDRDADGMPNAWESVNFFNPDDPSDAALDADVDGLTNLQEFRHMTRPHDADTDGDGLMDGTEVSTCHTNPLSPDSDNDGLLDDDEVGYDGDVNVYNPYDPLTNPFGTDTDATKQDTDGDGMPDGWEVGHSLDPLVDDAGLDPDGDTLANLEEYQNGSDPHDSDTDDDGLTDPEEVDTYLTDPANPDTDGDALSDGAEVNTHHTDPRDKDCDGDFLYDGDEIAHGTDPWDVDTDDDTFNDRLEVYYDVDPLSPSEPAQPKRAFAIGGMEVLFDDPAYNVYFPVWSSNGRRVAFIGRTKIGGETDVFVTNLDGLPKAKRSGTTPETIRISSRRELSDWRALAWSPDGTGLLYKGRYGEITRKSSSGDGVYFSPIPTPGFGLDIGIHTTSLPDNNRMIISSGTWLYVYNITPAAGIVSGPFLVFKAGLSEATRFVRLNADGTKAVFNIRPSDTTKGDIYVLDLEPILTSTVRVPDGIDDGVALGVIHAVEDKVDYAQCPSFTNDGEFVIWSEDIAKEFVEPIQPADLPYTNFDVMIGDALGVGVPQQMMFPVDDGQIHTSPGGLRMSYTRDWDLYAVTLIVKQQVEGAYDPVENNVLTDTPQVMQDGSGTELSLPASLTVDFPTGAEHVISMETPVAPVDDPQLPEGVDGVPVVRTFGPAGTTFSEPVAVTITYTDAQIAGMAEASLRVFVYNPVSGVFDIEIPESDIVARDLVNNSITFLVDHFSTFGIAASRDTDGDGIVDSLDADDDNDGTPDELDPMPLDTDNDGFNNDVDPDDDSDGIADADDPYPFDTDNDGVPNAEDPDDDNDGILDVDEATLDAQYDTDNDGQRNDVDLDDDGDGVPDVREDLDHDGVWDPGVETNLLDPDTDGDGYSDGLEMALGTDPLDGSTEMPISGKIPLVLLAAAFILAGQWRNRRRARTRS
jgi:hypothetical protein